MKRETVTCFMRVAGPPCALFDGIRKFYVVPVRGQQIYLYVIGFNFVFRSAAIIADLQIN